MASQTPRSLGVLNLESGVSVWKPRLGSITNPSTFGFPVVVETVEGAWADVVIRGDRALAPACIAAAQRLVERGAAVVSANCGFFIRHQAAVAASVNVPVALSSLLLVPTLLRQLPPAAKLAVVTADSTNFSEDLLGVANPADRARVVVGGIEGGKLLQNEMQRPPVPTEDAEIEADVAACVARLRAAHPEIAALLFECTAFPRITSAIRRFTGLPIYDITTLCRMTFASVV
ncbi:aspartate/glutamate racemase family protein [Bradyrhizobium sp. 25ACV]